MKKILFALLILAGFYTSAQTIAPSIINASGGATIINSNTYEWSIAEMVDVATYNTGSNFVTTGILQPLEEKLSVHLLPNSNTSVSIYPNPFTSIINLNIKSDDIQDIQIVVKNMLGQLVYQQAYALMSNNDMVQINLNQLSVGPYVIEVNNTNHNLLLTEKIIKND
jgi:hypothetical protein